MEISGIDSKKNSHVLFIISSLTIGGSERKTIKIANQLAHAGRRISIAYLSSPHTLRDEVSRDVGLLFLDRKGKFSINSLRRLLEYISLKNVSIICCINQYPLIYGYLAARLNKSWPIKLIATINTTEFVTSKESLQMYIYAPILRRIDAVVFGSKYQESLWVNKYELDSSICTHIYNGVDSDHFVRSGVPETSKLIKDKLGIPESGLIIGSTGRFRKEKKYETVINACVEMRNKKGLEVYCLLIGGGYEEQNLRKQVAILKCESFVKILDAVDDVRPYLEAMDIFVLSSVSETFSNSALEAMAMGLPTVLPNVGGCPEMISQGDNGYIYNPQNVNEFIEYLSLLCSRSDLRKKMGQSARRHIENNFRLPIMIESYDRLFWSH